MHLGGPQPYLKVEERFYILPRSLEWFKEEVLAHQTIYSYLIYNYDVIEINQTCSEKT